MNVYEQRPVVFTAQSKHYFYCRDAVCEFVINKGCVPLHPFQAFGYFLGERVERDLIRRGNFNFVRIVDELWVFGESIADGVQAEILYAHQLGKPIRFFSISATAQDIVELSGSVARLEIEHADVGRLELLTAILSGQKPNEQKRLGQ